MTKAEKVILGIAAAIAAAFGIKKLVEAKPPKEGDSRCVGYDLQTYHEGEWTLLEANSAACGWVPGEAEFAVTDLIIEPATVNVGEAVAISVLVSNIGGKQGTKTVTLEVI